MKIAFTKQLTRLREDTVDKVVFPSTLSNIERKYLHKLAEELGLKSKSHGKEGVGEGRQITVTKPSAAMSESAKVAAANGAGVDMAMPLFHLNQRTQDVLSKCFSSSASPPESTATAWLRPTGPGVACGSRSDRARRANPLSQDLPALLSSYSAAQARRDCKPEYARMLSKRTSLPAAQYRVDVCKLIKDNQVVLISGETGCGKTTQVPQFLLDDREIGSVSRIVVTQPRRLSAISVAERIAAERCEKIGDTVGYNIRLESEMSRSTQVLFVTPGVLLRKLQSDPLLLEFSHVIIDEAHERDRFTEFLLIVLRDVCARRSSLKMVLMSATMHTHKLSSYFGGVPHIHIGGSVFPVQEFFLEHVLRFTDYLGAGSAGAEAAETVGTAFASFAQSQQVYSCTWCGFGPFRSSEELGTHVAMCMGVAPPVAAGGAGGGRKLMPPPAPKKSTLQDLVSALSQVTRAADGGGGGGRRGGGGGGGGDSGFVDGADEPEPEAEQEAEAEEGDDDDDDEDPEDAAKNAATVEGADSGASHKKDDSSDDALLRQYQRQFDDSQVDYDIVMALLRYIFKSEFCKEGSVLVFFPGWDDISSMFRLLSSSAEYSNTRKYKIIQLHSGIPRRAQDAVFEPLRPGEHKIILSTNIAETSITIDDVAVVIDVGRLKEKQYDPHVKLSYLKSTWISRASARQRKGRAGRTRSGVCFHLFSKRRHGSLPEFQDSELLRMPLEELCLQTKALGMAPGMKDELDSVQGFLLKALDPPHPLSVSNAVQLLQSINCFDEFENLTPLGASVVRLPLDPRIGRVILLGCLCGVGPATLATAAAMGYRDPFVMPTNEEHRAQCNRVKADLAQNTPSDQMALFRALEGYKQAVARGGASAGTDYCDQRFLSRSTMQYLRDLVQQLSSTMKDIGVDVNGNSYLARNNNNPALLMALVGIGLYPDVGIRRQGGAAFITEKGRKAKIHPASVNARNPHYKGPSKRPLEVIGYQNLVATVSSHSAPGAASLLMLNTNPVSCFALLMNAGKFELDEWGEGDEDEDEDEIEGEEGEEGAGAGGKPPPTLEDIVMVNVDSWLSLRLTRGTYNLIHACRKRVEEAMVHLVDQPDSPLPADMKRDVEIIVQALTIEQTESC